VNSFLVMAFFKLITGDDKNLIFKKLATKSIGQAGQELVTKASRPYKSKFQQNKRLLDIEKLFTNINFVSEFLNIKLKMVELMRNTSKSNNLV
jgi:hypothetical protein